jgi:hypothetical protein
MSRRTHKTSDFVGLVAYPLRFLFAGALLCSVGAIAPAVIAITPTRPTTSTGEYRSIWVLSPN